MAEKKKLNLKFMRDKDREMVRGKFIFHEVPGGQMTFPFRKYKEDPVESFTLVDGEIYTLPLGVAKHLNQNCWYPESQYLTDEKGMPINKVTKKVRRCSFQSLEFIEIDELAPEKEIVAVEKAI